MSVLVAGLHHRSAPLDLLEDLAVPRADHGKLLTRLTDSADVREAVALCTCHRVEVYAEAARFHDAVEHIRDVLSEFGGRSAADVSAYLNVWYDDAAAAHLFSVASGLDSLVVGESEIQAQVKVAAHTAEGEGSLGRSLRPLFRHAMQAAKRVRTETGVARHTASVASAAVALVREVATVTDQPVAVLGAGQAAESAARALLAAGASEVVVVNRNVETGEALAESVGGRRVGFDSLLEVLTEAAVVICSTAAPRPLLTPAVVAPAMVRRNGAPLAFVDIALPRDVHPDVAAIPGVHVVGLDDVRRRATQGMDARRGELSRGAEIVAEEVERWQMARAMRAADPAVKALRAQAEAIAEAELVRRYGRLRGLSPQDRAEVEALVRAVVRKLMHAPTTALRTHAVDPDAAALASAAAVLFDLEIE